MTYTIHNNDNHGSVVYDIEVWLEPFDHDVNLWHSAIKIQPVTDGIIDLVDRLIFINQFDKDELKNDMNKVIDLPYWLYEKNDNYSEVLDVAEQRHYHVFVPHVREVLAEFCRKYGLYLNED